MVENPRESLSLCSKPAKAQLFKCLTCDSTTHLSYECPRREEARKCLAQVLLPARLVRPRLVPLCLLIYLSCRTSRLVRAIIMFSSLWIIRRRCVKYSRWRLESPNNLSSPNEMLPSFTIQLRPFHSDDGAELAAKFLNSFLCVYILSTSKYNSISYT